jgi:hypothetical protein
LAALQEADDIFSSGQARFKNINTMFDELEKTSRYIPA